MAKMLKIVWYLQNKNFLKVLTVILFQVLQLYMSCQNKMGFPVEIVWLEFKKMIYEKQVEKKNSCDERIGEKESLNSWP